MPNHHLLLLALNLHVQLLKVHLHPNKSHYIFLTERSSNVEEELNSQEDIKKTDPKNGAL